MEDLNGLLTEALVESPPALKHWPSGAAQGIKKVHYTHDAMIDILIGHPSISQNDLAAFFGYSASWISQVLNSDAFKARLAERRGEIIDPTLTATFEEHLKGMAARSLAILEEKLNGPANLIPDNLALRTLELSTKALGYGARVESPPVQVNVYNHLEGLGDRLVTLLRTKRNEALEHIPEGDSA